jgi:hypothetical protein
VRSGDDEHRRILVGQIALPEIPAGLAGKADKNHPPVV